MMILKFCSMIDHIENSTEGVRDGLFYFIIGLVILGYMGLFFHAISL